MLQNPISIHSFFQIGIELSRDKGKKNCSSQETDSEDYQESKEFKRSKDS